MFRRPPARSPSGPFGLADLEGRAGRPLASRRSLLWAVGVVVGGIAWGAAVHFADSLPLDLGFVATALKVGVGLTFVIGLIVRLLFGGFDVGRVTLVALLAIGGAAIGSAVGPTVVSAATVGGTFTFAPSIPAGAPPTQGTLDCEWAAGRWRIGALRTAPIGGLPTPHRLRLDLLRKTMSLADEAGSNFVAFGSSSFDSPADEPARGEGDGSGTLDLLLLQVGNGFTAASPNEVRARFSWSCPAPPPA